MPAHTPEAIDGTMTDTRRTAKRMLAALRTLARRGTLARIAGVALFGLALGRNRRGDTRTALQALAGIALFGFGMAQRAAASASRREATIEERARLDESGSDEAFAESHGDLGAGRVADESASVSQSDTAPNPRGMTDRSDVDGDEGGDIDFVDGEQPGSHRETHLEDETAYDPRLHPESDDERTQVDLSEAAMADENSEAVGPHPEQAYPAHEGTDPEPISDEAPPRVGNGASTEATEDAAQDENGDESAGSGE